jgi:hypothetical protein
MKSGPGFLVLFGAFLVLVMAACLPERKSGSEEQEESGGSATERVLGESYVLEVREEDYPVGYTMVTTMTMDAKDLDTEVKVGTNVMKGTTTRTLRSKVVTQVLGKDLRRVTVQMETSKEESTLVGGESGEAATKGVLVGQYVLVERREGVWKARLESGKEASAEEQATMDLYADGFNEEAEKPLEEVRRIGEEWEEDAKAFGEGRTKLRFDRLEKYQGQQCAVVVGTVKARQGTPDGGVYEIEAKIRSYRSLKYHEELYAEVAGTMTATSYPQLGVQAVMKGAVKIAVTTKITVPEGR